jgi:hypothetical protein
VDALDYFSVAMTLAYGALATWCGAAIIGGVLIFIAEWFSRNSEPCDSDVKRAAVCYRQYYGNHAFIVIGDHLLAASFAPDGRHRRFLKRVSAELLATDVTDEDPARAIETWNLSPEPVPRIASRVSETLFRKCAAGC